MADARLKMVKIKSGVVKRLSKEVSMYEKEAAKQREKVEKMKNDGGDEYDIRKQEEVLQESLMMIPDCQKRLYLAHCELKNLVETETDLEGTEEISLAQAIIADTQHNVMQQQH